MADPAAQQRGKIGRREGKQVWHQYVSLRKSINMRWSAVRHAPPSNPVTARMHGDTECRFMRQEIRNLDPAQTGAKE